MSDEDNKWSLTLYVGGQTLQSVKAIRSMRVLVDKFLESRQPDLVVKDVLESPELVRKENILALPTLVRESPLPSIRIIGDLADIEKVWTALNDE